MIIDKKKARTQLKVAYNKIKKIQDKYEGMSDVEIQMVYNHYLKTFLAAVHVASAYGSVIAEEGVSTDPKENKAALKINDIGRGLIKRKIAALAHSTGSEKEVAHDFIMSELRFPSSLIALGVSVRTGTDEEMTSLLESIKALITMHNQSEP